MSESNNGPAQPDSRLPMIRTTKPEEWRLVNTRTGEEYRVLEGRHWVRVPTEHRVSGR